jgi:quercetin dioxygenase-like cupin family protein
MGNDGRSYKIDGRELVAETTGLRVQILTIGAGQCVPWHYHSNITDTFFCLDGPMVVQTRAPEASHLLQPGDSCAVSSGQPHFVSGEDGGPCRFAIVQGVGTYDFIPVE